MEGLDFTPGPLTISLTIGLTTVLIIYWNATRNHSHWKNKGIPYIRPYPFLGSSYELLKKALQDVELARYFKYGKIYGHYEGSRLMLSVADPVLLKNILVKDFQNFSFRRKIPINDEIFSKMLNIVGGEDWKRIRAIVTPTFTTGKIKKTISIFKDCTQIAVQNFKVHAEKGEPVELKRVYGCYTMDVIASSAFSTKLDSHNDPDNQFVKHAKLALASASVWKFIGFVFFPTLMKLFRISPFKKSVLHFFCSTTNEIIKERKRTGQTRNDFLQLLLDTATEVEEGGKLDTAGNESKDITENYGKDDASEYIMKSNISKKHLSFNEVVAQCLIFFLAGYDTTASTLSFVTYLLAINQDAQDKARAEVDRVIEDNNGELTYEAIQSMKYMDNVISETLRLYPPLPRTERTADEDYKLGDTGIIVEKETIVTIPVYAIHRDPNIYPDPEKFDPERFSAEERAKRDPYTYLPFGLGPRNCVAMRFALLEVKVCLAYILSNFIFRRCPQTKVPLEFNKGVGLLQPKEITVSMELRNDRPLIK